MKKVKLKAPMRPKNRKRPIGTYHHQRRAKTAMRKAVTTAIAALASGLDSAGASKYAIEQCGIQMIMSMSYGAGFTAGDNNLSRQAGAQDNPWLEKVYGADVGQEKTYILWAMEALAAALAVKLVESQRSGSIDRENTALALARKAGAEINVVHRHGIMDSMEKWMPVLEADDLSARLLWESALMPTTRVWHASRHSKTYTAAEVEEFYQRDGNIYNCHCTVVPVITTTDGTFFFQDGMQKEMGAELSKWRKSK